MSGFVCGETDLARQSVQKCVGLTVAEIAQAFLVPETTMAQRITRAKKKIAAAKVPYRVPEAADLPEWLGGWCSPRPGVGPACGTGSWSRSTSRTAPAGTAR